MIWSRGHGWGQFRHVGQCVGRFEGRNDAFGAGAKLESGQRFLVGGGDIFDAADVVQPGMFGADAGVVEAGADAVGLGDLAVFILQQVCAIAVQHAGPSAGQAGGMLAGVDAVTAGLDTDQSDGGVVEEGMEQPHGVGAATDAGDRGVGQATLGFLHLLFGFLAYDGLEVADHHRDTGGVRRRCQ